MRDFWYAMLIISAIFIFFVLPTCMFWSESADETIQMKVWNTLKWETLLLIVAGLILFISYAILSKANIPMKHFACTMASALVA